MVGPAAIARRLTAQLLAGAPAGDPESIAQRLLAVQGQDPRGSRLAVRTRTKGLSGADVDLALTERGVAAIERSLTSEGPLTREQLGERISATGVRTQGQALVHLLVLASLRGLIVGWTSRAPLLGAHQAAVTVNGLFRPFALVRGRGVATWRLTRGEVEIEPFARITRRDEAALEADAQDVVRFLGLT